jgi:hypothetical protein
MGTIFVTVKKEKEPQNCLLIRKQVTKNRGRMQSLEILNM